MKVIKNFIGGSEIYDPADKLENVYNPATGEVSATVTISGDEQVEKALAIAEAAYKPWSLQSPLKRARILFKYKELLEENVDALAAIISQEHGKVLSDAKGEVRRGIEVVEFATGIPQLLKGQITDNVASNVDSYSLKQSLGVCVGISPFNFPAMVPMWMFPVAIAAGNTFVMKPSERDPSASMFLADLLQQAGLPEGVFNVVHGDKGAVDILLRDDRVKAVSFVGSTPVAQYIYETASRYGKRVQALGGAKNHLIVMPDADIEGAANALMGAAYGSAGERCMAISVAVCVGDSTADKVKDLVVSHIDDMKVGSAISTPEPDMGPLITQAHADKVKSLITAGESEGAELVVDGRDCKVDGLEGGYFVGPTLFDKVEAKMTIYQEEIFGPVLCIVRVDSLHEAINLVNNHIYANGTSIFTKSGASARHYVQEIEVGMVGVNVPIPVPMAFHSFGGWKKSLFGSLHVHGEEGVKFYTRTKAVTERWPLDFEQSAEFSMPTLD